MADGKKESAGKPVSSPHLDALFEDALTGVREFWPVEQGRWAHSKWPIDREKIRNLDQSGNLDQPGNFGYLWKCRRGDRLQVVLNQARALARQASKDPDRIAIHEEGHKRPSGVVIPSDIMSCHVPPDGTLFANALLAALDMQRQIPGRGGSGERSPSR